MENVHIYPIRFTKSEWKIPLYCNHICGEHCKYVIAEYSGYKINEFGEQIKIKTYRLIDNVNYVNGKCNNYNKLEKAFINLSEYNFENSSINQGIVYESNMKVINDNIINVIINFPLTNKIKIIIESNDNKGFTINEILESLKVIYKYIYDLEEQTSTKSLYILYKKCFDCKNINLYECKDNNDNDNDCSICYDKSDLNKLVKLDCNHLYHDTCIKKWIDISNTCPICRKNLKECDECYGSGIKKTIIESATIPLELRGNNINRNKTNGIFGIHTLDYEDIIIDELIYNRINKTLNIKLLI